MRIDRAEFIKLAQSNDAAKQNKKVDATCVPTPVVVGLETRKVPKATNKIALESDNTTLPIFFAL